MSSRSRLLPRRSCITVPGSSTKMVGKAPGVGADMVILDLEDAVVPGEKDSARRIVREAVASADWGDRIVGVRINDWTSPWTLADVTALVTDVGHRLDTVVLPKADEPAMVRALDLVLTQLERAAGLDVGHVGIDAQIESASGVANVAAIAAAAARVEAITLGPLDLAASLGMPSESDRGRSRFDPICSAMVVAARVAGVQVIDGPYTQIRDLDGLRVDAAWAADLGFDGKWALHPDQIDACNAAFSPTSEAFDRAVRIIEALDDAAGGSGALLFEGDMIDEASGKIARAVVERGRRSGLGT